MGGGSNQSTQKSKPWGPTRPYLKDIYRQAQGQFQQGALADRPFPSQTVVPLSPREEAGIQGLSQFGQTPYFQNVAQGLGRAFYQGSLQQPVATAGAYAPMAQGSDVMLGYDPSQVSGGLLGTQQGLQQQGQDVMGQFLTGRPDYSNVQDLTRAATRPAVRAFQEQTMPSIGHAAVGAGQVGGSRQGVAEGIAARGLQDYIGDTSRELAESERIRAQQRQRNALNLAASQGVRGQQLSQQALSDAARLGLSAEQVRAGQGLGLGQLAMEQQRLSANVAPTMMQFGLLPYQNLLQAGGLQRQAAQQQLSDLARRYQMLQAGPRQSLSRYAGLITPGAGLGGTQISTQPGGGFGGAVQGALGGAAAMAPLAAIPGVGLPAVLAGAAAGGLGGFF